MRRKEEVNEEEIEKSAKPIVYGKEGKAVLYTAVKSMRT